MSVNASLLLAHYNALKNNYRVVITHTGGTAMGQITSITAAGISVAGGTVIPFANITSLQATPV
jgi:hypothetical protein